MDRINQAKSILEVAINAAPEAIRDEAKRALKDLCSPDRLVATYLGKNLDDMTREELTDIVFFSNRAMLKARVEAMGRYSEMLEYLGIVNPADKMRGYDMVKGLANYMLIKLSGNKHKGGWDDISYTKLIALLNDEVKELEDEFDGEDILDPVNAVFECADVANFAGMIADKISKMIRERGV